jgi:hypothetical protein
MLLPDNIHPELSLYYNGAIIIDQLLEKNKPYLLDLFQQVKAKNDISFSTYILCLDWLFLIDAVKVNDNGAVILCS